MFSALRSLFRPKAQPSEDLTIALAERAASLQAEIATKKNPSEKQAKRIHSAAQLLRRELELLRTTPGIKLPAEEARHVQEMLESASRIARRSLKEALPAERPPQRTSDNVTLNSERHPLHNEDRSFAFDASGFYGVFDGVGGASNGEIAAELASETIQANKEDLSSLTVEETKLALLERFKQTRGALKAKPAQENRPELSSMNSTATVVKLCEQDGKQFAVIAHTGDSRAYILRGASGTLEQVTIDHTPVLDKIAHDYSPDTALAFQRILNKLESAGHWRTIRRLTYYKARHMPISPNEEALWRDWYTEASDFIQQNKLEPFITDYFSDSDKVGSHVISKSVRSKPELFIVEMAPDDELLLTSDGIHDNLTEDVMTAILLGDDAAIEDPHVRTTIQEARQRDPNITPAELLAYAAHAYAETGQSRSKRDDMTAVYARVERIAEIGDPIHHQLDSARPPLSKTEREQLFQLFPGVTNEHQLVRAYTHAVMSYKTLAEKVSASLSPWTIRPRALPKNLLALQEQLVQSNRLLRLNPLTHLNAAIWRESQRRNKQAA
ncbi:MAG: PP2C family protein-serine/threonine phosphatase [Patescibacteria group bacterium]